MATKTIVIGQNNESKNKKPIKVFKFLEVNGKIKPNIENKEDEPFNYMELICKDYSLTVGDLIFGYNDPNKREEGTLYFGQWNDGVVE